MEGSSSASGRTVYLPVNTLMALTGHGCQWTAAWQNHRSQEQKTGYNPTDWGKQGVRRGLMTDASGLLLSPVVAAENTHDIKLVTDTLDALQNGASGPKNQTLPGQSLRCRRVKISTEPPLRAAQKSQIPVKTRNSEPIAGLSRGLIAG